MRVLLDTHAWLWAASSPARLGPKTRDMLADGGCQVLLSPASSWEATIKWQLGRLDLPLPPRDYVSRCMLRDALTALPVEHRHTVAVGELPDHHKDPFDRLLIAQALIEGIPLVSADTAIRAYPVEVLWALD